MLISVVIPTRYRPLLLRRAIESVFAQSHRDFEIVVVVDGACPATMQMLAALSHPQLTAVALSDNVGLAEARNVGARQARGRYIALLDDDDEWLPEKLERQLAMALALGGDHVFVSCRFVEKTRVLERVMPAALPKASRHFSEYIYCEGGYLQPSTFFISRALLIEVPFTAGLRYIEDTDWLLRAMHHPKTRVAVAPQTLSIYYNLKDGTRESELTPWGVPLAWARTHHHLFSRKAFPFYVARLALDARRAGQPLAVFVGLLWLALRRGRLTPKVLGYFAAYCVFSDGDLKRLRSRFERTLLRRPDVMRAESPHVGALPH